MKDEPTIEYLKMKCKIHGMQNAQALMGGKIACESCMKELTEYRKQKKQADEIARFKAGNY